MQQKFQIGDRIQFVGYDYYWKPFTRRPMKQVGTVVGYNEKGYFPKWNSGFKRYKIETDDNGILYLGESRLRKLKEEYKVIREV